MIEIIYDFILNTLIGPSEVIPASQLQNLATLLTFGTMALLFISLICFVRWFFAIGSGKNIWRK